MNSHNRSQISSGIILVGLGVLFLLNTMGIINHFNWRLLFHFWPVIIIFIGVNLILKNTSIWWLTTIIFVLGIIAFFIVNNEYAYYQYNYSYDFRSPFINEDGKEIYRSELKKVQGLEKLEIDLNFSAGRLFLDSVKDEDNLYEVSSQYRKNPPQLSYLTNEEEKTGYLRIDQNKDANWFNNLRKNNWELNLTPVLPLFINFNVGAGFFKFNLEDLKIEELKINSGAGELEINLGNYAQYIKVNSAAANLELNVPEGKAISVKTAGLISNNNFSSKGLVETVDDTYQSSNFNNAVNKLIIDISAPASNIELNFYRVD